jgi:hypothetical protein
LRFEREQAIKLKLDICGERSPQAYLYTDTYKRETGERFNSNYVDYKFNGSEYTNIYGLTLSCKKEGGTKTEIWIRRSLEEGKELPENIEELEISARLIRTQYEQRHYGLFRITIKKLVLISDGTNVNSSDTVIGPIRYYVAGTVNTEVFTSGSGALQ